MTTETRMPRDANGNAVPVLRSAGVPQKVPTAGVTAILSSPFTAGREVIEIYCRFGALRYKTGPADVVASAINSDFIDIGERLVIGLGCKDQNTVHTHISVIRDGATDGTLEISEKE